MNAVKTDVRLKPWMEATIACPHKHYFKNLIDGLRGSNGAEGLSLEYFESQMKDASEARMMRVVWVEVELESKRLIEKLDEVLSKLRAAPPSVLCAELTGIVERVKHSISQAVKQCSNGMRHDMDDVFCHGPKAELWYHLSEELKEFIAKAREVQLEVYLRLCASEAQGRLSWHQAQIPLVGACRDITTTARPFVDKFLKLFVAGVGEREDQNSPCKGMFRLAEITEGACFGNQAILSASRKQGGDDLLGGEGEEKVAMGDGDSAPSMGLPVHRSCTVYSLEKTELLVLAYGDYQKALATEVYGFLRTVDILRGAAEGDLQYIAQRAKVIQVGYQEQVVKHGEQAEFIYIVWKGDFTMVVPPAHWQATNETPMNQYGVEVVEVEEPLFTHDKVSHMWSGAPRLTLTLPLTLILTLTPIGRRSSLRGYSWMAAQNRGAHREEGREAVYDRIR